LIGTVVTTLVKTSLARAVRFIGEASAHTFWHPKISETGRIMALEGRRFKVSGAEKRLASVRQVPRPVAAG